MRLALFVVASITFGCAAGARGGGGGILIPPVEIDVGAGAPVGAAAEKHGPSTEILAGIHWASLAWKPTRFDAGVGYVGSFRAIDNPTKLEDDELRIHGGYLQLGTTIASGSHWRTWFAARGELLRAYDGRRELSALGTAVRLSTELYNATLGGGRNTAIVGTVALGIYVEAVYRDLPSELGTTSFTSGISCRLPFLVAGS